MGYSLEMTPHNTFISVEVEQLKRERRGGGRKKNHISALLLTQKRAGSFRGGWVWKEKQNEVQIVPIFVVLRGDG